MFGAMLQIYDKALLTSALALAVLASPSLADTDDPASGAAAVCDLSDGYSASALAFAHEATACVAADAGTTEIAATLIALTDRAREKNGMAPLASRDSLGAAATAHAMDMAARGYASHSDTQGLGHADRVRILDRSAIFGAMGANVTVVDARLDGIAIHNALMADPVNAENMARGAFTHGGVGMAEANGERYIVQLFAQIDGELETPLPVALPRVAGFDVAFADDGFDLAGWRLEDNAGLRVRSGTINRFQRRGEETGQLSLAIEAVRDNQVHTLKGPIMDADAPLAAGAERAPGS